VTTDYVAKLNQLSKPANYNPEDNAAPYYQKAFDLFVKMPETLYETDMTSLVYPYTVNWLGELDPNTVNILQGWYRENQPAFEQIKLATEKPYYWIERKHDGEEKLLIKLLVPDLNKLRITANAMLWGAVIKAYNGNDKAAFNDILMCYKMGMHKSNASLFMMEQLLGQKIKKLSAEAAMVILDRKNFKEDNLKSFHEDLSSLMEKDNFTAGFDADKLQQKEFIELLFADDPLGPDRLAFENRGAFQCMCGDPWYQWIYCFVGADRKEVSEITDELFLVYEKIRDKTPWEIKNLYAKEVEQIKTLANSSFFTKTYSPSFTVLINRFAVNKAAVNATITTIAILRYDAEQGSLPASLEKLVSASYLKELPVDPYSDKPLRYIVEGDNFKLYSVGRDFEDNKLKPQSEPRKTNPFTDSAFLQYNRPDIRLSNGKIVKYWDTIYWPIKRPDELEEIRRIDLEKRKLNPYSHNKMKRKARKSKKH
jgi:hypothetical protein